MKKSKFGKLNLKDILKGAITAVIMAVVTGVYQAIQAGQIDLTWLFWKPILLSSVGAGLAYLLKNWLTNSKDNFITKETT